MAQLTSILSSDLISTGPSVLTGNFQNLNLGLISIQSSVVNVNSVLSQKVQVSSTAGATLAVTTLATDKVVVWARGTLSGSTAAGSVALLYNGVTKDALEIKQAAAADQTSFSLMYSEIPGAGTFNVTTSVIANGALAINNPKIIVQVIT